MRKKFRQLDPSESHEREHEPGRISLWISLLICFGLASFCFWMEHVLQEMKRPVWSELFLHVGVAFVVAATIIAVIEFRAHRIADQETRRFRDQVSRDVFQALLGRIVPPEVFFEINDILHTDTVRRDCRYRIIFKEPHSNMPPGYFIIRREVTYTVSNLLSRKTIFKARSSHSEDVDLVAAGWQNRHFHLTLLVANEPISLEEGKNLFVRGSLTRLEQDIPLGPRESKEITLHGEEPSLVSAARNTYLQATPVINIEVEVLNDYREKIGDSEVQMNHPAAGEARLNGIGRYELKRAFLPGQGFQVIWREAKKKETEGGPV